VPTESPAVRVEGLRKGRGGGEIESLRRGVRKGGEARKSEARNASRLRAEKKAEGKGDPPLSYLHSRHA